MTSPEDRRADVLGVVDGYIDDTLDGLLANVRALEMRPADRPAGAQVTRHLVDLERLYAVRRGLRDA